MMQARLATVAIIGLGCAPAQARAPGGAAVPPSFTKEVSFAVVADYDKGQDLAEIERDFALMKQLGVRTWRGGVGWDQYEPARGRYDFEWLHRFAELAERYGIELRPYIAYTPAWAAAGGTDNRPSNDPPASLDEWTDFVRRLVSAMSRHPNVRSWEIYNEENVQHGWDGTGAQYAAVLAAAARVVREAHPRAEVLLGGLMWPEAEWVKRSCGAARVDIVPFHAYPETWTPDSVDVERYLDRRYHDDFLPAVRNHCGSRPVWINELGFSTQEGRSERDQANWWARAFATFLADPAVRHLGIYEIKDVPPKSRVLGDGPNSHSGLTRRDRTPKLAFHTVDLLTDLLDVGRLTVADGELTVRVTGGSAPAPYHHLFVRPDERQVLIVWDKHGSPTLEMTLTRSGTRVTEYTLDGRPVPFPQFDGRTLRRVRLVRGHVRIFAIAPQRGVDPATR